MPIDLLPRVVGSLWAINLADNGFGFAAIIVVLVTLVMR